MKPLKPMEDGMSKGVTQPKYSILAIMVQASFTEFCRNKGRVLKGNTQHHIQVTGTGGDHPRNPFHSMYVYLFIDSTKIYWASSMCQVHSFF